MFKAMYMMYIYVFLRKEKIGLSFFFNIQNFIIYLQYFSLASKLLKLLRILKHSNCFYHDFL